MHFCWALLTAHFKGSSLWVFSFPLHCISWWCKTNCGWCCCWDGLLVGWLVGWLWFLLPWFVCLFFPWLCQMLHAFLDSANLTVDDAVVGVWLFVCLLCFLLPPAPRFFHLNFSVALCNFLWQENFGLGGYAVAYAGSRFAAVSVPQFLANSSYHITSLSLVNTHSSLNVCSLNAKCLTQNLAAQKSLLVMKQEFDSAAGCWMSKK